MPKVTSQDFAAAVERYIDQEKPDRIRETQIQSWQFEWTEATTTISNDDAAFPPDHVIQGTLRWTGEYIGIHLESTCYWKGDDSIVASCTAQAFARSDTPTDPQTKKLHHKMIQRIKRDETVQTLLENPLELYDASITSASEERVCWNEPTCRAIQASLYGTAESALEVFEFICSLPILPGTAHASCEATTNLADRLKLRLLEDATYDACEAEDSDAETTVEDLSLHSDDGAGAKRRKRS